MSSYLPDNHSYNVGNTLVSPLQQVEYEHILSKQISRTQDTIAAAQKQDKKNQAQVGERPSLPPAGKSKNPNYLSIVAQAFCKAFDSMAQGTINQVKSYADLQELDETMSQSVLQSTKNAIDKENKQIKLAHDVEAYQKKCAKEDKIFGDIMLVIGIVLIVATVVSALFDAGASLAAVPEEGALIGAEAGGEAAAEAGGDVGMEAGDIEMDTFSSSIDEDEAPVDPEETGEPEVDTDPTTDTTDTQEDTQTQQAERETNNELDRSNEENSKSENNFKKKLAKWLGKKALHLGAAFGFASPMLMKGIQGLKTAGMLSKTADAQKQVGAALSVMQQNNSYFQFYQQLLQRASGVAQEETNDSSQVVDTFGDITNAYQQISYGLASSV